MVAEEAEQAGDGREGEGAEDERHGQSERVEGEQHSAASHRGLGGRGGEDRPQRRAGARQPGDREREPGHDRPAGVGTLHEVLRAPLLVQERHEEHGDEEHAHRDQHDPGDLAQQIRWSWSVWPRPVAVIPRATNIAVNERQKSSAGPRTLVRLRPSWMSANETPEIVER